MKQFVESDGELVTFHTSAVGVAAQRYESEGGAAFDSWSAHARLVHQCQRGTLSLVDRIGATLVQLPAEHRRTIALVYTPHGWPAWLASKLHTPWGGGNFVAFAAASKLGAEACKKAHPNDAATPARVLQFLLQQGQADALFGRLRTACERARMKAIESYDELRVQRIAQEKQARTAQRDARARRNEELLDRELRGRDERQAAKFAARLRGVA